MIDDDTFCELECHISWGHDDPARQALFLEALRNSPALAGAEDEFGSTLLMTAAEAANLEAVRELCRAGANPRALASTGDTPLICAVRGFMNDAQGNSTESVRAEIVDVLIQHGADPNQLGYQGCIALHYAVIYGLVELVRHLLRGGGDPAVRLCDPPSEENAIELAESGRGTRTEAQKREIIRLLKGA